ncbi:MAG: superfamily II DNA and RNA helicase [Acidobacteria bacterium OLB17]|nr:MAG: superfamily II DNA and RNA helicase [Acidobacteria bacterium OLB17]MCZ2390885.1 DEAD/DEAH box helicase family protein [Acidobacteriota bacterium]
MQVIDNLSHFFGDNLRQSLAEGSRLRIAAATFSIYAFEALRTELEAVEGFDFIFTSPTFVPQQATDGFRKERREYVIPRVERERGIYGTEFEIQLKNKLTQRAIAKECAEWIAKKATFRSNKTKAPMQQFACIEDGSENVAYMPLQGFTAVDLGYQKGDAVSNFITKFDEPAMTKTYLDLFEQIWADPSKLEDVTQRICDHIASVYKENSSERIYFLMLFNIFNEFLEDINDDVLPNDLTGYKNSLVWKKLYNFQRDAVTGIINKLETHNGCILADSVGLGKTFSALAVIKYYELRNRAVLVLCPKKLAENWTNYNRNLTTNIFAKDRFNYDVLCHTDLQRTRGESLGIPLNKVNWSNYDLVVIDESHNFRNNDQFHERETRYQKLMNTVIKQGVKTKVLMLSATPVNNRFADLRNQLALAYEGDSENLSRNLKTERSVEEIFRRAQLAFNEWSKLPPEERTPEAIMRSLDFDFFELLDSVTIARSRKHIEKYYDTTDIGTFPERRKPISNHCPLTQRSDVIGFNDIFAQLTLLKLAVYAPVSYILDSRVATYEEMYDTEVHEGKGKFKQVDRETSLQRLMTINLLKRLESSVEAFRITLRKLRDKNLRTLGQIEAFQQTGIDADIADVSSAVESIEPDEDDFSDPEDMQLGGKIQIKLSDLDLPRFEHDLKADLEKINYLLEEMEKVSPVDDTKLQHLRVLLESKVTSPINPGNKKVLIFTAFADTADYLYEHISGSMLEKYGLHTAKVTGKDSPKSTLNKHYDFQSILTLFSPRSKDKDLLMPEESRTIEFLIGTDCISEGQNLQDCDYLVNYDIHWNPVRIIQRFGRIDRIGSTNESIQLVNYWPDISLDEYINLKDRVESRMVIADVTATGDDNPLSAKANDLSYRKEQLRRLQDEVIDMEDLKTGVAITDLGLNDFRMDLVNYMKGRDDVATLPSGLHAVVAPRPEIGLVPGAIFALRNRNEGVSITQHNRLHPYYLVYVDSGGKVVIDHTQVKKLLDLIRTACAGRSVADAEPCRLFNEATNDGRDMEVYSELLNRAIQSIIEVKDESDLDSLFRVGKTTALVGDISGLNDFELIAFIVVQEMM